MANNQDLNPSNGNQGSSYLYRQGTSPNTRAVVSQKVRVLTPSYGETSTLNQMGVLSSFSPSESKSVDPIRGIGYGDQVAELVPGVTQPMELSFERALLYLSDLHQSLGYASGVSGPVRSLKHHRWPFDVEQQMVFSSLADADFTRVPETGTPGTGSQAGRKAVTFPGNIGGSPNAAPSHTAIITLFEGCWMNNASRNFSADQAQVMESGSATVTDVHDFNSVYGEFLRSGNDPTLGELGSNLYGG